jgi:hypothetical protein
MRNAVAFAVALLAVVLLAFSAHAVYVPLGTVDIEFLGHGAGWMVPFSVGGQEFQAVSGAYRFHKVSSTGEGDLLPDPFCGFCIEPDIPIWDGSYDVVMPEDAPNPGFLGGGQMGPAKAFDLSELWGRFFNKAWCVDDGSTLDDNYAAAAFGIAIWEIIIENPSGYDVTSGFFAVDLSLPDAIIDAANQMLCALTGDFENMANLRVLTDDKYGQDILVEVPEPGGLVMVGSGLLALLMLFRRRKYQQGI